jgi:hypothetical protein
LGAPGDIPPFPIEDEDDEYENGEVRNIGRDELLLVRF